MRIVVCVCVTLICVALHAAGTVQAAVTVAPQPKINPHPPQAGAAKDRAPKPKAPKKPHHANKHPGDAEITQKVRLAFMRVPDLAAADIDVESQAGIVRLSGEVENSKLVARAKQLAAKVKGVKKVDSQLTVRHDY
jgi:osmotically-inducible protein OsmY